MRDENAIHGGIKSSVIHISELGGGFSQWSHERKQKPFSARMAATP
jgi:hypothetical protein